MMFVGALSDMSARKACQCITGW